MSLIYNFALNLFFKLNYLIFFKIENLIETDFLNL